MRPASRPRPSTASALALTMALLTAACQPQRIEPHAVAHSRPVSFRTGDGVKLAGRLFGPSSATAGVVLAPMLPGGQSSWFEFADRLGTLGYLALTFDLRGYCPGGDAGCSGGAREISAAGQDVAAAAGLLRSEGIGRLALIGASVGGTASLVAAGQDARGIGAIVTLSAPTSFEGLVAGPDLMQTLTPAKLYLAGDLDTVAAQAATDLYDQSLQPKRLDLLTTADRGTDLLTGNQSEQSRTAILTWLAQYVPVDEPTPTP